MMLSKWAVTVLVAITLLVATIELGRVSAQRKPEAAPPGSELFTSTPEPELPTVPEADTTPAPSTSLTR